MVNTSANWVIQLLQCSQGKLNSPYIPYGAGLLQAYVMRHAPDLTRYTFLPFHHERLPLAQSLEQIQLADVYAFSTYVWNVEYSLALARGVKARKPGVLTIFGGPQVPNQAERWLREHPEVDVCVHGEGERVFLALLESLPDKNWSAIQGISWIDADGVFHYAPPGPRIEDLDEIPSPYLMGLFDSLLSRPECNWLVIWESNRGCPFTCTFCDWGSATATKLKRYSLERIKTEIDWFVSRGIAVVSLCDSNFGMLKRDLEITDYVIESYQRTGFPSVFFMQNAKNVTERSYQIHHRLIEAGIFTRVTLAMQSLSPQALTSIRRENISLATYHELHARFSRAGVPTYTDILVGLPGETYDSFVEGVSRLMAEGQHDWISFYNVYVLPNAELAQPEYRRKHGIITSVIPYSETWFSLDQEVPEWQEMVIATATLDLAQWRRVRAFAWWTVILHYNYKLLQLPLLVLNQVAGLPWRDLLELFSEARFKDCQMLGDMHSFLLHKAGELQEGKSLHCLLNLPTGNHQWIDVENFIITGLSSPPLARAFFAEAGKALNQLLAASGHTLPPGLLEESLQLSEGLFVCAIEQATFSMPGRYNLWEAYQAWMRGQPAGIRPQTCRYVRDWFTEPLFDVKVEKLKPRLADNIDPAFSRQGL